MDVIYSIIEDKENKIVDYYSLKIVFFFWLHAGLLS